MCMCCTKSRYSRVIWDILVCRASSLIKATPQSVRELGSTEGAELAMPESQRQHAHRVYHCTEIVYSYRCVPEDHNIPMAMKISA